MHRYDIQAALKKRHRSLKSIADELAISKSVVTDVVAGRRTSFRVATHVASVLGLPVDTVWPSRAYGQRTSSTKRQKGGRRSV